MQLDRRAIESALLQKGFAEGRATHHRYFHHEYGGKRTGVDTYTSHGSDKYKTYGAPLLSRMKKELKLDSVAQLADLVNCPMSRDGYNEHLKGKGLLPEPQKATGAVPRPGKAQKTHKRRRRH